MVFTDRAQSNDGHSCMLADVEYAVFMVKIHWGDLQLLGHPEDVHGTQNNIIPVGTAFSALVTVEFEGVIQSNCVELDILKHHFFSCHMRFLHSMTRHRKTNRCRAVDVILFRLPFWIGWPGAFLDFS